MPDKANIWVSPHPDGWQTHKEGSERASGVYPTQQQAIDAAVAQAKREQVEVIVQREDGTIRSKDSYGNDPNPPKDTEH
jgi:hypothetical protein